MPPKKPPTGKRVTRYSNERVKEPRTPETGHTALMPADAAGRCTGGIGRHPAGGGASYKAGQP